MVEHVAKTAAPGKVILAGSGCECKKMNCITIERHLSQIQNRRTLFKKNTGIPVGHFSESKLSCSGLINDTYMCI